MFEDCRIPAENLLGQEGGGFMMLMNKLQQERLVVAVAAQAVAEHVAGKHLVKECSMAKLWQTEMADRVVDQCLQFFGGYGYMLEYPIARAYMDARVQRIYAGTNEIMKVIIAKQMGL